jgi:predicted MFS family arabinose efflux permease
MSELNKPEGFGSAGYRKLVLAMLLLIYIFNVIDRILLAVLQEKIKADLLLSDFQLGLLGGPAFVILYTLAGIPIARFAERANRVSIVAIGAAVWSVATAVCGLAQNFVQMAAARVAVGIGEAACIPPSHSIISDYFPANKRATAFAIYGLGIPLGTIVAAVVGGMIAQNFDWRAAFFMLGVPGILAALALKLVVKEPPRKGGQEDVPAFGATIKFLAAKRSLVHVMIGGSLVAIFAFSVNHFMVSYLVRRYDLEIAQASGIFGLLVGVAAAFGIFFGGFLSDKLSPRFPKALSWVPALGILISIPLYFTALMQDDLILAAIFFFVAGLFHYTNVAPMFAIGQAVADPRMRATVSALVLTSVTLLGYGFGPPLTGAIADRIGDFSFFLPLTGGAPCPAGQDAAACAIASGRGLQFALTCGLIFMLWASLHYYLAGRSLLKDREG